MVYFVEREHFKTAPDVFGHSKKALYSKVDMHELEHEAVL